MFGLAAVPSAIMFLGCLWLPESPSWLVSRGACEDAREVLVRLRGTTDVNEELQAIQTVCKEEESFDKKSSTVQLLFRCRDYRETTWPSGWLLRSTL
ncbi:putative metabolite transport protein YwtG, partial [Stylophora pistillata]